MVKIVRIRRADARLAEAVERLLPQLSGALRCPSLQELEQVVASRKAALFAAEADGRIVGMLTLAWYDVPSGRRAWIEDVVVEAAARGGGIGEALVRAALTQARRIGAGTVSLTSSPARVAAHALYRKVGFETYDTTVFRRPAKKG